MHQETTTRPSAVPIRSGIVTLSGFGIKVAVDPRHLAVSDGIGRQRRAGRFAKATSRIKRLVVIAQTGFVTLEALRWLHDAKAAFIQLDHESSDPSSRHAATALRCLEAVLARRRCASRVVVGSWPAARMAAILAGPPAWNAGVTTRRCASICSGKQRPQYTRFRIVSLAPQLRQALGAVAICRELQSRKAA